MPPSLMAWMINLYPLNRNKRLEMFYLQKCFMDNDCSKAGKYVSHDQEVGGWWAFILFFPSYAIISIVS